MCGVIVAAEEGGLALVEKPTTEGIPELRRRTPPSVPDHFKVMPLIETAPLPQPSAAEEDRGFILFSRPITQPVYRNTHPQPEERIASLSAFATKGEYEPLTFSIYPLRDMRDFRVVVSDLQTEDGAVIDKASLDLRLVTYWNMRHPMYTSKGICREQPELLERVTVNSFDNNECQRYWLTVHVPKEAKPGMYQGHVTLFDDDSVKAVRLPVRLRVLGYQLKKDPNKHFSSFHLPPHQIYKNYTGNLLEKAITTDLENMQRTGFDRVPFVYVKARKTADGSDELFFDKRTEMIIEKSAQLGLKGPIVICGGFGHFYRRYVPGGTSKGHFRVSKIPTDGKIYAALESAARKFRITCQKKGYPELVYLLLDEPRSQGAEFSAKLYAAVRHGGMRTIITNDPTTGYSHFYREHDAIDIWWPQSFAMPYEKIVADKRHDYWCYPNHNAGEIKDRVVMQKGGRMTYGFGFWRSGYTTMMPWAWRWCPSGKPPVKDHGHRGGYHDGGQFDYLAGEKASGTGNRIDEEANFIPAIYWECFREGYDDGRYLYTLQQTMAERQDSPDLECVGLVKQGQELLNEIWQRTLPKKKYMRVDFLEDESFGVLRWRMAQLTMQLLKYPGNDSVVAPSVMADSTLKPYVKDDVYFIQKGLDEGTIDYLDLAQDEYQGWKPSDDKEMEFSIAPAENGTSQMQLKLHVDHQHKGIGWPLAYYHLRDEGIDLGDYDFLFCKVKFKSNRDAVANDVTRFRFSLKGDDGEHSTVIDLGGNEGVWGTIKVPLKPYNPSEANKIILLPFEGYYPDQTEIVFTFSEIGLVKFKQPSIKRIVSLDHVLQSSTQLAVGLSGYALEEGAELGYECEVLLKNQAGEVQAKERLPLANRFKALLPTTNLPIGTYQLDCTIYDNKGKVRNRDSKTVNIIPNYE